MDPMPTYRDLVPVFSGDYARAVLVRSALEANGIEAFIPNENIRVADPFMTGANALDVTLVVAAHRADAAAEVLAGLGDHSREVARREAETGGPDDHERARLAVLGRRIRFGVCCVVTLPLAAWYGVQYLSASARSGIAPPDHGLNVLLSLVALGGVLLAVVWLIAT